MKILTKNCIVCGKKFTKKITCSRKDWKLSKFCSMPCINKGRVPWNFKKKGTGFGKNPENIYRGIPWNKNIPQTESVKQKIREARVKQVMVKKDTSIELSMEKELRTRSINYQKQVPLEKVCVSDFYLSDYRVVIFCDGDYWHNLPNYKIRDKRINKVLRTRGYKVYRFWEHDIEKSISSCVDKICAFLATYKHISI